MQKRSLVIFSLLILSILFIAGCQEAVGGRYSRTQSAATDSTVVDMGNCPGFSYGQPVEVKDYYGNRDCHKVIGCVVQYSIGTRYLEPGQQSTVYAPAVVSLGGASQFCQGAPVVGIKDVVVSTSLAPITNPFGSYPIPGDGS